MLYEIISNRIKNKHIIGLGTGNTIKEIIQMLPSDKIYVPASLKTLLLLNKRLLKTTSFQANIKLDLYIDGADLYDKDKNLLKGGGASLVQEKIMMKSATESLVIVQKHKFRNCFKDSTVAIEILPFATNYILTILDNKRLQYRIREGNGKYGPVLSDIGGIIIDVDFKLDFINECKLLSGVLDHGYFSNQEFNYSLYEI